MRFSLPIILLAAAGTAAAAQDSQWGYFEAGGGLLLAGVAAGDGSQLILKCDKKGKREVYTVVVTQSQLVPPRERFVIRDVAYQFDGSAPATDDWRYQDNTAAAVNTRNGQTLTRFLRGLADAGKVELRFNPVSGGPVVASFDVAGAREAIGRVYEACGDEIPIE